MERCKNCEHEIEIVFVGKAKDYWHSDNLIKIGATTKDCKCGCAKPEPDKNLTVVEERVKDIILKAEKLGWVQPNPKGYPLMQLSEVEKCMVALLDKFYMRGIDLWIEEKEYAKKQEKSK